MKISDLLNVILDWVYDQQTIRGVALVGSYARDAARPDSDVDIVCLTSDPTAFRSDVWVSEIDWQKAGLEVETWADKDYGGVWSRHIQMINGLEVEMSFGALQWAKTNPIDAGTLRVMSDGHRILYDPDGILQRFVNVMPE